MSRSRIILFEGVDHQDWKGVTELGCAFAGVALVWLVPQAGPWPLALAALPWLGHLLRGRFPFQRTPLDLPIALFLVTALVGAWASYDRQAALSKLWILLGAIIVYYAVSRQSRANFWIVWVFLSASAAGVSIYFLLTLDVGTLSTDLKIIDRLVAGWIALRPQITARSPHPNIAGGLIALMTPFMLALLRESWQKRQHGLLIYTLATGGIAATGLLISSSRGAWLALGMGLVAWLLWGLSGSMAREEGRRQGLIFAILALLGLGIGALLAFKNPVLVDLLNHLPSESSTSSRLEIYRYSIRLVRDFPYTGGGLDAFAGLFSQYIKVTPNFIIGYSHNLYLDVAIEQGLPGLAFFLFQLAEGVWLLLNAQHGSGLRGIVLAGLVVLLVHGLVDDPLYANRGTPFLFLIPALVVASSYNREDSPRETAKGAALSKIRLIGIALALIAATILAFIFRFPLLSAWDANIGAVQMARTELADFPSGKWDDGSRASQLASTEALFQKSLELDPMNVTANYRLGLIHMLRRDFPQALSYLEKAYTTAPGHRGVQKNLAYTFVWVGQLDRAQRLLRGIEEGQRELEVYTWWWTTQGRPDLAKQAEEMLVRLP